MCSQKADAAIKLTSTLFKINSIVVKMSSVKTVSRKNYKKNIQEHMFAEVTLTVTVRDFFGFLIGTRWKRSRQFMSIALKLNNQFWACVLWTDNTQAWKKKPQRTARPTQEQKTYRQLPVFHYLEFCERLKSSTIARKWIKKDRVYTKLLGDNNEG